VSIKKYIDKVNESRQEYMRYYAEAGVWIFLEPSDFEYDNKIQDLKDNKELSIEEKIREAKEYTHTVALGKAAELESLAEERFGIKLSIDVSSTSDDHINWYDIFEPEQD